MTWLVPSTGEVTVIQACPLSIGTSSVGTGVPRVSTRRRQEGAVIAKLLSILRVRFRLAEK